jgi:hypothetical protein
MCGRQAGFGHVKTERPVNVSRYEELLLLLIFTTGFKNICGKDQRWMPRAMGISSS